MASEVSIRLAVGGRDGRDSRVDPGADTGAMRHPPLPEIPSLGALVGDRELDSRRTDA